MRLWPWICGSLWAVDATSDLAAVIESDESPNAYIKIPRASVEERRK